MSTGAPGTNADLAAELLSAAPAPEPRRPRILLVGASFASVASALAVLTLVAVYASVRGDALANGTTWLPEDAIIPLTPGNMGMASLLMSAVTMQWAVYALRNNDRINSYLAIGVTLLLGISFVNTTAYLYSQMNLGIADSAQAVLIYSITGLHLAMTVAAMVFIVVMGFQALGGQLSGRSAEGMSAAALYWYVTIAVYAVVWYAIYITK